MSPRTAQRVERRMTRNQRDALGVLAEEHPTARVVGWDTSVNGPLVAVSDDDWDFHVAISPRGKQVDRIRKDEL